MNVVQKILGLLALSARTPEQEAELTAHYLECSDAELADLELALVGQVDEIVSGEVTPELLNQLGVIADHVDGVRFLAGERITASEEAAAAELAAVAELATARDALLARVRPVVEAEVTPDVVAEAEAIVEEAATETPQVPVTAAAVAPVTPRATIGRLAPQRLTATPSAPSAVIKMAGTNGHFGNRVEVEHALLERWNDLQGTHAPGKYRVATFQSDMPSDRVLTRDMNDISEIVSEVRSRITENGGSEALVADGGICGPVEIRYATDTIAQASRPLRAYPMGFNAARGGINFQQPMRLTDILNTATPTSGYAIGAITEAQDAAATYNKSVQRVSCGSYTEVRIEAVYRQLEFGNFQYRTNPERNSQFVDLSVATFARFNEQRLYNKMLALCVNTDAPQKLGALRDFITAMNRAAQNYRMRNRMPLDATLDTILPAWVAGLLSDDMVNAFQAFPEQFHMGMGDVERMLSERNIRVVNWFQDDFTTALSSGGAAPTYPTSFKATLNHPGAWTYLDGGTLDLGVIRDSTLVNDNLLRIFTEEFWNVAMTGVEAMSVQFSLCANGASAGSRTPTCGS